MSTYLQRQRACGRHPAGRLVCRRFHLGRCPEIIHEQMQRRARSEAYLRGHDERRELLGVDPRQFPQDRQRGEDPPAVADLQHVYLSSR